MTEILLNRRGINSIEVPDVVEVEPGSELLLRIINLGSPLHITLASQNSSTFTGFFLENLYVNGPEEFVIPIRENVYPGTFTGEGIAGYGARKAEFRVVVREPPAPECECAEAPAAPAVSARMLRWRSSAPALLLIAAALVLYGRWLAYRVELLNAASFAALLLGVILAWLRQRA